MNDRVPANLQLLNDFQRDFPLVPRPYAAIAARLGIDEQSVIDAYGAGLASGVISRIGAVLAPRRLGASTLAAMAVPAHRLEGVAATVGAHASVNHNYEREGDWNLWFVVVAPDNAGRKATLDAIARDTGLPVLTLPLVEEYHIDLGFDLLGGNKRAGRPAMEPAVPGHSSPVDMKLLAALQDGLPLTQRPYADLGARAGLSEGITLAQLEAWLRDGLIKRLGVVVHHRELGYTANAMCVWDVPDEQIADLGRRLAEAPGVTLCYRRQRALPAWPYNLYCMIHGKQRTDVRTLHALAADRLDLHRFPSQILFSRHCFKQCGSRFTRDAEHHE